MRIFFLFYSLVLAFAGSAQYSASDLRMIDSLQSVAESNVHDTLRLKAYMEWDNFIYAYDRDLDVEINRKMIEISANALNQTNHTADQIAFYLGYQGMAHNNIGLVLVDYGNYKEALSHFQMSLQISEHFNDSIKQSNAYNNIGMIYKHLGLPDKALDYYNMSYELSSKDAYSLGTYNNNIGVCYLDLGDTSLALSHYRKSIVYADSAMDYTGKGNTLLNIGLILVLYEAYDSAIWYLNEAITTYQVVGLDDGIAFATKNLGDTYYFLEDYPKSIDYCLKALNQATHSKSLQAQKESCDCLYRSYKKMGKIKEALTYHERYLAFRDSLELGARNEEVIRLDFQFNMDRQRLKDSLDFAGQQEVERLKFKSTLEKKQLTQYVLFIGIALCIGFGIFMLRGYLRKKRDHETIARQKSEVETQKHIVEEKNKEITDSINYAKRIQDAILPGDHLLQNVFSESFILYKPKDIVAGDFYWLIERDNLIFFAVADCTGHGVPGALVSVVCHNALNRSVNEFELIDPGKILDKTRELVVETFEQKSQVETTASSAAIRDGMDIALCVWDPKKSKLLFAGANNGAYYVQNSQLQEVLPDKQPIGKYAEEKPFTTKEIPVTHGDIVYLYTDGFADQFGGPQGKKFKYKQLKELIIKNSSLNLQQQKNMLNEAFDQWKGNLEQIDDVCLVGVQI